MRLGKRIKRALPLLIPSKVAIKSSLVVFAIVIVLRWLGMLQFLECDVLDIYFQSRPVEKVDSRIVLVEITESDISQFQEYPLSDYELYDLLAKIQKYNPRAIGIDLYRDVSVNPEYQDGKKKLTEFLDDEANSNIIGIEKAIYSPNSPKIPPHPILAAYGQVGSNDTVVDNDKVVRRAVLYPDLIHRPDLASFNLVLAGEYLRQEGFSLEADDRGNLKIGSVVMPAIEDNSGGYANIDSNGYQILLNYRSHPERFPSVKAFEVVENRVPPKLLKDKVVIICTRTPSFPDIFYTPYSFHNKSELAEVYGGWVQANATSQIISAVLDNRPLLKTWPETTEIIWIFLWILVTACGVANLGKENIWNWNVGQKKANDSQKNQSFFYLKATLIGLGLSIVAIAISWIFFYLQAWWLPVVPAVLGIAGAVLYGASQVYVDKLKQAHDSKDAIIYQQTLQLRQINQTLIEQKNDLVLRQEQLVAQKKLASIGLILAGISHDIGKSIGGVYRAATLSLEGLNSLKNKLAHPVDSQIGRIDATILNEYYDRTAKNISEINRQIIRTNSILEKIKIHSSVQREKELNLVKTNINEEIDGILKIIKYSLEGQFNENRRYSYKDFNRVIWTFYDESVPDFYLDVTDLQQVIQNLTINALDTVESKKMHLNSRDYQPTISITTKNGKDWIKIIVKDNGEGIDPAIQEKIFEAHYTTKPPEMGSGLGLSNVRDCLIKSGGKYRIESDLGKGTDFIIFWPIVTSLSEIERPQEVVSKEV